MHPNALYPHPDANSSSLAYLYDPPPDTEPDDTPDPALNPAPPQLRNRAHPQRTPLSPTQDLMDVDTGTDTSGAVRDTSADHTLRRGLERARPDTDDAETLEHSKPVYKQRRTGSPEPATPAIHLSPETIQKALLEAVTQGKLDRLQSLVNQTENIEHIFDGSLWEVAATHGHLAVIDWLSRQADKLDLPKPDYTRLFEMAAGNGKIDTLKWLVKHGCNIQQVNADGNNALTLAAEAGELEVVQWLAGQGCNIHHVNAEGNNALTLAAEAGELEVVQWLVEHGCNIQQVNADDDNALTLAAGRGRLEIVQWLAGQGCDIHHVNKSNDNALTLAAGRGRLEIVQWLAGQGCNIHHVNKFNDNALTLAAERGHLEVVQWLAGQKCNIHQVNNFNNNALTLAAHRGQREVVQWLAEKGLDINQVNSDGYTALALSMTSEHSAVACDLIMRGANLTIGLPPDSDGYLFSALDIGNTVLINMLITRHDVSKRSESGFTPLMIAAKDKLIEVAVPLIRATLRVPDGGALVQEALKISTDPLFKELLNNPSILDEDPSSYSWLSPEGVLTIQTSIVHDYVSSHVVPWRLQSQLGSGQSMTPIQKKSAQAGSLAELPAWKLANRIGKIFNKELTPSLLPIQKRVATFISDDIDVLATQANGWEEDHLVPVIEHLYPSCLMHSLSAHPAIELINELADKGLYHPIARRIAAAWTSAWAALSGEARPLLLPMPGAPFDEWDLEDLPNFELINGGMVIRPDTVPRNIDRFVSTPVGVRLLQAFCATLKDEFDAVESRILHPDDVTLPQESKNLYADLIMRQLHLVAQFWRAELS